MIDGHLRRVVMFPDDGHPDLAANVLDLTGDQRDEIVLWDQERVWIYTQDRPFQGQPDLRAAAESGLQRIELSHQRFPAPVGGGEDQEVRDREGVRRHVITSQSTQRHFGNLASGLLEMQHMTAGLRLNPARSRQIRHLFRRDLDKKDGDTTCQNLARLELFGMIGTRVIKNIRTDRNFPCVSRGLRKSLARSSHHDDAQSAIHVAPRSRSASKTTRSPEACGLSPARAVKQWIVGLTGS